MFHLEQWEMTNKIHGRYIAVFLGPKRVETYCSWNFAHELALSPNPDTLRTSQSGAPFQLRLCKLWILGS